MGQAAHSGHTTAARCSAAERIGALTALLQQYPSGPSSSRFIVNLPAEELESIERICFQIEQAHWYYEDFVRPQASHLPSFSLRKFSEIVFSTNPLLACVCNECMHACMHARPCSSARTHATTSLTSPLCFSFARLQRLQRHQRVR